MPSNILESFLTDLAKETIYQGEMLKRQQELLQKRTYITMSSNPFLCKLAKQELIKLNKCKVIDSFSDDYFDTEKAIEKIESSEYVAIFIRNTGNIPAFLFQEIGIALALKRKIVFISTTINREEATQIVGSRNFLHFSNIAQFINAEFKGV